MGIFRLERVEVAVETAFGSLTPPSLLDLRALEVAEIDLDTGTGPDMTVQQFAVSNPHPFQLLKSESKIRIQAYLTGYKAALGSAVTYTQDEDPLSRILRVLFGGQRGAGGTTCTAGCTTTVLNVTAGHGNTRFAAGGAIVIDPLGGTAWEVADIASVAANTITLEGELSSAPADTRVIFNVESNFPDPDAAAASLFFRLSHADSTNCWTCAGVFGGMSIQQTGRGQLPVVNFDFMVANHERVTNALAAASYVQPTVFKLGGNQDRFLLQDKGVTTRLTVASQALAFGLEMPFNRVFDYGGVESVAGYQRGTGRIVPSIQVTEPFRVAAYTDYTAGTAKRALAHFASTRPGSSTPYGWAFGLPNAKIRNNPKRVNQDDQGSIQYTLTGDMDDSDPTIAEGRSSVHLYRF